MTTHKEVIQESTVEAMTEAHCEGTMRDALEAVIVPLLAKAWEEGAKAQEVYESCYRLAVPYGDPQPPTPTNPYTAEAQVDGL